MPKRRTIEETTASAIADDDASVKKARKTVKKSMKKTVQETSILSTFLDPTETAKAHAKSCTDLHNDPESVMNRPTFRARLPQHTEDQSQTQVHTSTPSTTASDKFSTLPADILARICRYIVVDREFFVYPCSESGREQPDLAMACKAIRNAVLPIYYSENHFALDYATGRTAGPYSEDKWLKMTEQAGYIDQIKLWVLRHDFEAHIDENGLLPPWNTSSGTVLVLLDLSCDQPAALPKVEIHGTSRCLLYQNGQARAKCTLAPTPEGLLEAVVKAVGTETCPRIISQAAMLSLIKDLSSEVLHFAHAACEEHEITPRLCSAAAHADTVDLKETSET